jgi:microcystin-dependent protein
MPTPTYSFNLPTVGAALNSWGTDLNNNWTKVDELLDGTQSISGIDINGGSIDGTPIGAASASTGAFTTVTATSVTAALTGAVTGDVTGNVTGDLTGNANTATRLSTARAFSISGGVTASGVNFDGTGPVELAATLNFQQIYPVGSIYMSTASANPGTLFANTTWAAFGEGRVLIGAGTGNDGTDSVAFTAGNTGGLYNVTLTDTQIPDHYHHGVRNTGETTSGVFLQSAAQTVNHRGRIGTDREYALEAAPSNAEPNTGVSGPIVTSTGGAVTAGQSHTNVQPHVVVYMWQRTS